MEEILLNGPDQIKPAEKIWTTNLEDPVKLWMRSEGLGARPPVSIPGLLARVAKEYGDHPALRYKQNGVWQTVNFRQYKENVDQMAKVFIKLGLEQRRTVCILGFNCKEWFFANLATIQAGGIVAGVYPTNSADAVQYILNNAKAQIVVVDELKQYEKIISIKDKLQDLKAVIQIEEPYGQSEDWYYHWEDLMSMDVADQQSELDLRLSRIAVNECCLLVYTSGTVGEPKGVMLSHDNLTFNAYNTGVSMIGEMQVAKEVVVSYLPLSHAAAQLLDIYAALEFAITIYFAQKDALKGSLIQTLKEARPTRLFAVPRVYEKIEEKMLAVEKQTNSFKLMIMNWAKEVTLNHHMNEMRGNSTPSWEYRVAKKFIWSKVRESLGFDRIASLYTGAAPISESTKKYFMSIDLPMYEVYGMSETTGTHTLSPSVGYNFYTCGKTLEGYETKLGKEQEENGDAEILMRGRNSFMGYVNSQEKTQEAIDDDGWILSGDLGKVDADGFVYITGRIKELLITAGGENVPPVHVEELVKKELPLLSNTMLVGDRKKFLSMLITLKTEMDPETSAPKDQLHPDTIKWMQELGLNYTKLSEILATGPDPKVMKAIEAGVTRANKNAISNAQKVQKFAILPHDFSTATGELGPTLKLKRNVVTKMYHDLIENFYKM